MQTADRALEARTRLPPPPPGGLLASRMRGAWRAADRLRCRADSGRRLARSRPGHGCGDAAARTCGAAAELARWPQPAPAPSSLTQSVRWVAKVDGGAAGRARVEAVGWSRCPPGRAASDSCCPCTRCTKVNFAQFRLAVSGSDRPVGPVLQERRPPAGWWLALAAERPGGFGFLHVGRSEWSGASSDGRTGRRSRPCSGGGIRCYRPWEVPWP